MDRIDGEANQPSFPCVEFSKRSTPCAEVHAAWLAVSCAALMIDLSLGTVRIPTWQTKSFCMGASRSSCQPVTESVRSAFQQLLMKLNKMPCRECGLNLIVSSNRGIFMLKFKLAKKCICVVLWYRGMMRLLRRSAMGHEVFDSDKICIWRVQWAHAVASSATFECESYPVQSPSDWRLLHTSFRLLCHYFNIGSWVFNA